MAWITPRPTWNPTSYVMYSDWNRMSGNAAYLQAKADEILGDTWHPYEPFTPYTAVSKGPRSFPLAAEWNDLCGEIQNLAQGMFVYDYDTPRFVGGGSTPTYRHLNDIEEMEQRLYEMLNNVEAEGRMQLKAQLEGGL